MKNTVIHPANILLPKDGVAYEKWAVVAVDQYTSQIEYWQEVEKIAQDAPSALHITLPEVYLKEDDVRIPKMHETMKEYLAEGILEEKVAGGYIFVERTTETGVRLGLMACLDLEEYDYAAGSQSLIRATEGTVIERVPPRVKIRRGAQVELPHVLMLLDDAKMRAIEPLYEKVNALEKIYDFDLMMGGGHLRGWKVCGEDAKQLEAAFDGIYAECEGLFLAVGDGNHSLAAARAYWLEKRESLPEAERKNHPARYALVEIENLHSPAIQFEPIHRIVTNVDEKELVTEMEAALKGELAASGNALRVLCGGEEKVYYFKNHPLRSLQAFLDEYLARHPEAGIDYIHGDDTVRQLAMAQGCAGFMPCAFEKAELFPFIRKWGVLPRKTFSMGHAHEKRYYCEVRRIEK